MQELELLKNLLIERAKLNEEDLLMAFEKTTFKQFNKGDLITSEGNVENYMYFIIEGMARAFFYKEDKETSLDFFFTGNFFNSFESFSTRMPSRFNIEALTTLSVMRIKYEDLQEVFDKNTKFQIISRVLTEELFRRLSERLQDLLSLSATERYHKLLNTNPEYVQSIPLKYLASYLNITPESLSRIRKGNL